MGKWTFNMTFFCKRAKINKKGNAPIYARVTTSGQAVEIYTQCLIAPEHWDQRAERSLCHDAVSVQINSIVATYRANILAAYDQLIKEGKEPSCFAIKERLANPHAGSRLFLAEFAKYCDKRQGEVGTRLIQKTANKYHRLLRYLREYTQAQYRTDERLGLIRDVFAFCCFTGLAFTDADHLRPEHITTDETGVTWIRKPCKKTAVISPPHKGFKI